MAVTPEELELQINNLKNQILNLGGELDKQKTSSGVSKSDHDKVTNDLKAELKTLRDELADAKKTLAQKKKVKKAVEIEDVNEDDDADDIDEDDEENGGTENGFF